MPLRLFSAIAAVAACRALQTIDASDPAHVTLLGRPFLNAAGGGVGLGWLGAGVRVSHTGKVLRATFAATTAAYKVFATVSDEGYSPWQGVSLVAPSNASESVALVHGSGLVDVLLSVAPQYFDSASTGAVILTLTTDGAFNAAPAPPARTIHILGDSITAATNIHGGVASCADEGFQCDYSASWGSLICELFGASCSTIAVGGKCIIPECGGTQMPDYYRKQRYIDAGATFAFNDTAPDAVIVFLGTNDGRVPNMTAAYVTASLLFMGNVTQYYPGSHPTFFFLLGPMSPTLPAEGVAETLAQGAAAGFKMGFINATEACHLLPGQTGGCTDGCATHPGVASHRNMARTAAPIISAAMGWPMTAVL